MGQHQIAADAVICTIPFSVLAKIEILPALSLAKRSSQAVDSRANALHHSHQGRLQDTKTTVGA